MLSTSEGKAAILGLEWVLNAKLNHQRHAPCRIPVTNATQDMLPSILHFLHPSGDQRADIFVLRVACIVDLAAGIGFSL
jgi:hypothetical protein